MLKTGAYAASAAAIVAVLGLGSAPTAAHHSFAMFDQTQTVRVTGKVTRFDWLNPHSWLYIEAPDGSGVEVSWGFETSSPAGLAATGWRSDILKPGDEVIVDYHPLRDGTNGGQLRAIWLPDGTELCNGAECREAAGVE
jgi:hypothetical protein